MANETIEEALIAADPEGQDLTAFDPVPADDDQKTITALGSAEAFEATEHNSFLLERSGRVIAIIGEHHSGKTTIPTALYGFLKEGAFGALEFAESRTLIGLEKRLHTLTIDSGRPTPKTARTTRQEDLKFLHLELAHGTSNLRRDLFFSDRAGEHFAELRAGEVTPESLIEVAKADYLIFLLDGALISSARESSNAYENVRQTIITLVENDAIRPDTPAQVVTTKWDLVKSSTREAKVKTRLDRFEEELKLQFSDLLPNLSFWRIAAQGSGIDSPECRRFADLVSLWVCSEQAIRPHEPVEIAMGNEFERLQNRIANIE